MAQDTLAGRNLAILVTNGSNQVGLLDETQDGISRTSFSLCCPHPFARRAVRSSTRWIPLGQSLCPRIGSPAR